MGKIRRDDCADRSVVRRNSRGSLIGTCRPFGESGFKFFGVQQAFLFLTTSSFAEHGG